MILRPLAIGNSWTYVVTALVANPVCAAGTFESVVQGMATVGGQEAFSQIGFCSPTTSEPAYSRVADGQIEQYIQDQWMVVLGAPVQEGHSWPIATWELAWRYAGTVTVAAGTFDDCWDAVPVSDAISMNTYCAGVGVVRVSHTDFEAELVSYSLVGP